jgi:Zn-dependent protease with chaperone function
MSSEAHGAVPAGELDPRPGTASTRGSPFALPASTSFRFALLIAAVVTSSSMVYEALYGATPRGPAVASLIRTCLARALAPHPRGLSAYASALGQARGCRAGAERVEGLWVLLGIGVLCALAVAIYCAQPWWYRRRMQLSPLTSEDAPQLMERLEQLRERARTGSVVWLLQPFNAQLSAFAFGRFRRRFVAVSGGAAVAAIRQPAAFDAVVLHELAHIRNRDINQTYLAIAIWRAFAVTALLPMIWLLAFSLGPEAPPRLLWRAAVLALIVYSLRNSILRSREFDADARVLEIEPDAALGAVLASQPPRRGRRMWHLGWLHPSGQDRAAALQDPVPLYRCGFWDGLTMGLVAAIGAEAAQQLVYLLFTARPIGSLIPAAIFALFSGAALTVAMWRKRFPQTETPTIRGWTVGLGLGLGLAIGPVITLFTASDQGVAPDTLNSQSIAVLAIWVAVVTLIFISIPVWIGYWADAWQLRAGTMRVPARGGLAAAAVGTWVVLAIGLGLVLAWFTFVENFTSGTRSFLEQTWTSFGMTAAEEPGAWIVCLVFIAVPLAAWVIRLRQQPADSGRPVELIPRTWARWLRPAALICLAGAVAMLALTLVMAAVVHTRIAPAIRWNAFFFSNFVGFEQQQAIVLVAVLFAVIAALYLAAVRVASWQSVTIAVVVGAVVAALGILARTSALAIGGCSAPFSVTYTNPPGSSCSGFDWSYLDSIRPAAIEAALGGILLVPAAYHVGVLVVRRSRARPGLTVRALQWSAVVVVAAAVIVGLALHIPDASANGTQYTGSIGDDGWVRGVGYEIRLFPNWYDQTPAADRAYILAEYGGKYGLAVDGAIGEVALETARVRPGAKITGKGGYPILLSGTRGLGFRYSYKGNSYAQWIVIRDLLAYKITLLASPGDYAFLKSNLTAMLDTWRWD